MGWLDRFTEWSERRLRKSQLKILYQNQAALSFLAGEYEAGVAMKDPNAIKMSEELDYFQLCTDNHIADLAWRNVAVDPASQEMFQINKMLRNAYQGYLQGKQAFRAQMGEAAGENTAFELRFMPASGWEDFGEAEWKRMLNDAMKPKKSDPFKL